MAAIASKTQGSGSTMLEKEGKYLTFALAQEEYGLEILKVREIIGYVDVNAAPPLSQRCGLDPTEGARPCSST